MVPPTTNEMNNLAMWQHFKDGILQCCRCDHMMPAEPPEDVEEEELKR